MSEEEAVRLLVKTALEWAGEYGFVQPDRATAVVEAATLVYPELVAEWESADL